MSILSAALFLELWKKYSAEITHRWDLTGLDTQEEYPRPQYLARLAHIKKKSINVITNTEEPKVPYWKMRVPATILSFSVVLLLVCRKLCSIKFNKAYSRELQICNIQEKYKKI